MAVSEDAQAIIDAIEAASTAITGRLATLIQAQDLTNNKLDSIIPRVTNIDNDLDTVIDKESRVIRGMGLQGQALNASVSYKIKDPAGEKVLSDLNNLDSAGA